MNDQRMTDSGANVAPKQQSTAGLINYNLNEILDRTGGMANRLSEMERFIYGNIPRDKSEEEEKVASGVDITPWKDHVMHCIKQIKFNLANQEQSIENLERFHK